MARNKKAQILAAVMCASSILGGYTVVSAQSFTEGNSTVSVNDNSISAKVNGTNSQSTITVGDTSLSVNVGSKSGTFNLYSKNLDVNNSAFSIKSGTFKVGENFNVTNSGKMTANDGMNVTDKYQTNVYFGSGNNYTTSTKVITANTTTSYAGITNKIDTTLDGHKTYTSSTVVGPTSVTTTVQGNGTIDGVSGSKNKITSTVNTTGVTDKVYDVKENVVASSSVTTSGIANTTNLYTTTGTDETMITASRQDKNGVSISAKKNNSIEGTSTSSSLVLNGENANLGAGAASVKVNATTGNVAIAANGTEGNVTLSGKNIRLTPTSLSLYDGGQSYASLSNKGLTINGTSQSKISATKEDNSASTNILYNNIKDTVTDGEYTTTSSTGAKGVTTSVKYNDNNIASSSVTTGGIKDYVYDNSGSVASSVITDTNGTKFSNSNSGGFTTISGGTITALKSGEGTTTISGGTITATEDIYIGKTSLSRVAEAATKFTNGTDKSVNLTDLTGIERDDNTTTIEKNTSIDADGIKTGGDVTSNGGTYSLNTVGANTQAIKYINIDGKNFTTFDSGIKVVNDEGNNVFLVDQNGTVTSKDDVKATTTNGTVYSLKNIGANTAGIERDAITGITTIEGNQLSDSGIKTNSVNDVSIGKVKISALSNGNVDQPGDIKLDNINVSEINRNTAGITKDGAITTIENVGFAQGRINASKGALIGGVDITDKKISNVDTINGISIEQLRDATAGNITDVADLRQKTTAMSYDEKSGVTSFDGDVKSGNGYSLNAIGANTAGIQRIGSPDADRMTTLINDNLFVQGGLLAAGGNFSVDANSGKVSTKGDVVTLEADGTTTKYSLNTIGDNTQDFHHASDGVTEINGSLISVNGGFYTGTSEAGVAITSDGIAVSGEGDVRTETYSLNTVGANTAGIQRIGDPSVGMTTVIDDNLFVQGGLVAASGKFSVDANSGKVSTKGDVVTLEDDGTTTKYSLNTIGDNTANITRDGFTTNINGELSVSDGNIIANKDVYTTNVDGTMKYSLNQIGAKTAGIEHDAMTNTTTVEGVSFNNGKVDGVDISELNASVTGNGENITALQQKTQAMTYSNGTTSFEGNISSTGDVTSKDDEKTYSLNTIGSNTAGIKRDGETTTIEGNTSINKDGIKVGNNVEINANGSMTARNGDAYFNFDKDNIGLSNGNNTLSVGNESITIDSADTKMVLNHDGLDYADGAFYVRNDGTVTANGSMTADDFITKDGVKLSEINSNIETATGTIKGIKRDDPNADYGEGTTSIEGVASFNKDEMTVATGNSSVNINNENIILNNNGNGVVINDEGTSIFGAQGKHSINITTAGTEFVNGYDGTSTVISGGTITTDSIKIGDNTIDDSFFGAIGQTNGNTAGIRRELVNGQWTTYIEGNTLKVTDNGYINLNADKLTYSYDMGNGAIGFGTLGGLVDRVDALEQKTQGIDYDEETGTTTIDGNLSVDGTTGGSTGEGGTTTTTDGNIAANTANIGGVEIGGNTVTAQTGKFENIAVGGEGGTTINKDGVTVGNKDNYTSITNNDVVVNNNGTTTSLTDVGNRVTGLESSMNSMNNRLNDVEDRIDKVGAMSAAIANLRTMGFDPEAPTEIAIGIGQYKSETGIALGVFHYPNQDFMLSASISTSGDEVMGGIGATWKLGRKSSVEKAKDEEAKHLEKAEEMKKLAQESKVKAQAERHAKLLAEREAQKTA